MNNLKQAQKNGTVALVGRPNAGKSTLLNNILGTKVSITSPKPQTTRFSIEAVYEDDRGQIVFVDTPGIFAKAPNTLSRKINRSAENSLDRDVDVVVYVIDHTRTRDIEENKTLGLVRKWQGPKVLAVNKVDIRTPDHRAQYMFMEEEFDAVVEISALTHHNLNILLNVLFELLPTGKKPIEPANRVFPALNIDSKLFIAEIIREKIFLFTRKEVPYTTMTRVDEVEERENNLMVVHATIITSADRYKGMLVGKAGFMIKEIGMAVRKELEAATGKKFFIDLTVDVDPHWPEMF